MKPIHQRRTSKRRNYGNPVSYDTLEPRQLLTTFYVDASAGSDSNAGTEVAPLASYLPFVSAYGQSDSNVGRIQLQPGDEVVFAAGVYDETFRLPGSNIDHGFRLRNVHGNEAAPITLRGDDGAVLQAAAANGSEVTKLELFDASHFVIEGFEVTGLGTGIQITNSHDVLIEENWIHDIDGQASSIIAGLAISTSSDVEATGNLIHDNYDRGTPAFNSYNVEFDENVGYVEFHNNYVFNSVDNVNTGTGPGVKHDGAGLLEIHSNVITNAANAGIALDTRLASVHHNLVLNSEAFWLVPNESIAAGEELHDIQVFNNTIIDQTTGDRVGGGLNFSARVQDSDGSIEFNDNIVVDLDQQGQGQGILNIAPYGSNEEYRFWVESDRIQADGNVYFNPNHALVFDVYSAQSRGDLGGQYTFEQWQQLGFDQNGRAENPLLNSNFQPTNSNATQAGWYAGQSQRLTVLASDTDSINAGQRTTIQVIRSGDQIDLQQRQTVQLTSSVDGLLELPDSITFEPGQSAVSITVTANAISGTGKTNATRISASSSDFENSVSAWLRIVDAPSTESPVREIIVEQTDGRTSVAESGSQSQDELSIRLSSRPAANVTLRVNANRAGEVELSHRTLVFTPTNWNISQTIQVSGVADGIVDGDQQTEVTFAVDAEASEPQWTNTDSVALAVTTLDTDTETIPVDPADEIAGFEDGVLTLPGSASDRVTLDFLFTERLAQFNNELGVIVLDADGTINGVSPADRRFAATALGDRGAATTIFASREQSGARSQLAFAGGTQVVFYLIQNSTREKFSGEQPSQRNDGRPGRIFLFKSIQSGCVQPCCHFVK